MAIKINKKNLNDSNIIKDNAGFTFTLEDNTGGFGFICSAENDIVITIIAMYDNGAIDHFSVLLNESDDMNFYDSIKIFLEDLFECNATFVKGYKQLEDMNITVDLEVG